MGTRESSPFGSLLRHYRLAAGLSQETLAELTGLSTRGISDLERGARTAPRLETLRLLAASLGVEGPGLAAFLAARSAVTAEAVPTSQADHAMPPLALTPLVGREREIRAITDLLCDDDVRLVTLTGPGGVGKTRLAQAVAHEVMNQFADGVVFVDLSPVRDAQLVLPTIAAVFGVQDVGAAGVMADALVTALGHQHVLLILDNLEQAIDAAPDIAMIVSRCPWLKVLATSRILLRLTAEQVFPVSPLQLPDGATKPSLPELAQTEAVAFFVNRASAADLTFHLTEDNSGPVAEIVRRLEGLPLAIELAAVWTRTLPPEALLARLERRLPLLTGGSRDAPLRQRTMRDAIAWSHDLLTPHAQALFRRLGVFVGGFTFEAAEAVTGRDDEGSGVDFLDGIASLIERSLLRREMGPDAEPRYVMLETVREFGLDQLVARGETPAVRAAHATYFLQLAEQSLESFLGPEHRRWLDRVDAEQGNLRAAATWFEEANETDHLLRLARALGHFWYSRGHLTEGRSWLDRALSLATSAPLELGADGLAWASGLAHRQLDIEVAVSLAEASLVEWQKLEGTPPGRARAVLTLAIGLDHRGDKDRAAEFYAEAAEMFRAEGQDSWAGIAIVNLALVEGGRGRVQLARDLGEQGLSLVQSARSAWGVNHALAVLGDLALDRGDHDEAVQRYHQCLTASIDVGDPVQMGHDLVRLGVVAATFGDISRAVQLFGAVEALREGAHRTLLPPNLRPKYEAALLKSRESLGENAFKDLWRAGRGWSLGTALTEAAAVTLGAVGSSPPSTGQHPPQAYNLTERELDVLRLMVAGKTDREIAEELFISRRTVTTHVGSLLLKLGVTNRVHAATVAIQDGLL
ncbi:MAG TPA: LuxR C-terminal-related transcriptional regulator [Thermomicrobiales bacterium]|nr:LuxR C-terminal-related transcriptional regulator [Thermomicrobiales bacterium]